VLFVITDQDEAVVMRIRQSAKVSHLSDRNQTGLVHNYYLTHKLALQRFVNEKLLERVGMGRNFCAEYIRGADRGSAAKHLASIVADRGHQGTEGRCLSCAGVALQHDHPVTRIAQLGNGGELFV
jgi:hypothetical protein